MQRTFTGVSLAKKQHSLVRQPQSQGSETVTFPEGTQEYRNPEAGIPNLWNDPERDLVTEAVFILPNLESYIAFRGGNETYLRDGFQDSAHRPILEWIEAHK